MSAYESAPSKIWSKSPYRKGRVAHLYLKAANTRQAYYTRCFPAAPVGDWKSIAYRQPPHNTTPVCPQCAARIIGAKPKLGNIDTGVYGKTVGDFLNED